MKKNVGLKILKFWVWTECSRIPDFVHIITRNLNLKFCENQSSFSELWFLVFIMFLRKFIYLSRGILKRRLLDPKKWRNRWCKVLVQKEFTKRSKYYMKMKYKMVIKIQKWSFDVCCLGHPWLNMPQWIQSILNGCLNISK